jgi:putative transposase
MTGRVTMLGISRFTNKGGSYRTVQRFFDTTLPWINIFWLCFRHHIYKSDEKYILAGDETVVTKSGTGTHGIDKFYSSLYQKPVSAIAFFALSLVGVKEGRSTPISIEQVVRTQAEKDSAKARSKARKANKTKKNTKQKSENQRSKGRPVGSKNKNKSQICFSPELTRINSMIDALLRLINGFLPVVHLVLDGHFGHNQALLMARKNNLHLISKLRHDSALYEQYEGVYSGSGPRKKYGNKLSPYSLPEKYLKQTETEGEIVTRYYQGIFLHKEFTRALNVVIIVKTNKKTGAVSHVILFSSDHELGYEELVKYYRLRFQIEFNFRDAKQHWGLEDFMNVSEAGVTNAANISFFMVSLSQVMLKDEAQSRQSVLDLKCYYRALKYIAETIKMLVEKPEGLLLEEIIEQVGSLGRIHTSGVAAAAT